MTAMIRVFSNRSRIALLTAGIAGIALLGGCSNQAPHPDKIAQQSREALGRGQTPRAVALAEQAVQADGRNPTLRLLLGNAYLRSGRFESARQAFSDAIELGDDSSRGAIGLVLCELALGHNNAALDTINTYGDVLPAADLGLALAMAGQSQRGIDVLTGAIRRGQNAPKVRENLAYAYALAGMWAEARIMAGQDLPADKVDARVQSWASMARPEDARRRVASLLGAPVVNDNGQPEALALAHFQGTTPDKSAAPEKALAAAPATEAEPAAPATELPPAQAPYPSGALARIELTPSNAARFVSNPVVQPVPVPHVAAARTPSAHSTAVTHRVADVAVPAQHGVGTHLVQLGSFNSEESARRAWHHFVARNPALQNHPDLVTKVSVRGRDFWRLQAAGFAGQASASTLCGSLRAHGGACLVMAVNAAARVNGVQTADAHPSTVLPATPHPVAPVRPAATHPVPTRPGKVNAARR